MNEWTVGQRVTVTEVCTGRVLSATADGEVVLEVEGKILTRTLPPAPPWLARSIVVAE